MKATLNPRVRGIQAACFIYLYLGDYIGQSHFTQRNLLFPFKSFKRPQIRNVALNMDSTDSKLLGARKNVLLRFSLLKIKPNAWHNKYSLKTAQRRGEESRM